MHAKVDVGNNLGIDVKTDIKDEPRDDLYLNQEVYDIILISFHFEKSDLKHRIINLKYSFHDE